MPPIRASRPPRCQPGQVGVTDDHYQDMAHPFFAFVNVFERSNEAVERVAEQIRAAVTSAAPPTSQGGRS